MNDAGSFSIVCTPDGRIVELIEDSLGLGEMVQPGRQFMRLVRQGEVARALYFLQEINTVGEVARWLMGAAPDEQGRLRTLAFSGARDGGRLRVTGSTDASAVAGKFDARLALGAVQATVPLDVAVDGPGAEGLYDEITCLNNELVSAQREVAKRNAELRAANLLLEEARETLRLYSLRLERSNRDLADFAAVASHDLQEPLRKVLMFSDMLAQDYAGVLDESGRDHMERMVGAARRMQSMINDLLAIARATTQPRHITEVDLAAVVADVLSDLEPAIARDGAVVQVGPLPRLEADATQMRQLVQNLVGNALKFHIAGRAPHVVIEGAPVGDGACRFVVADNGIGFEMSQAERIFKPLQRLVGHSAYEGSGLGLAICQRVVERHGGDIAVTSAPGRGARFTVTLPVRST